MTNFFVATSLVAVLLGVLYQLEILPTSSGVFGGEGEPNLLLLHPKNATQEAKTEGGSGAVEDDDSAAASSAAASGDFNEADEKYQPRRVTQIGPATKVLGSLSSGDGTPWCRGEATFWFVGHEFSEAPYCRRRLQTKRSAAVVWERSRSVVLDDEDSKSVLSGWRYIDRHDCAALDVDGDGVNDIVCVLGANRHKDKGWTELYLTQKNGTVVKVKDHGLHQYPTMSTRYTALLRRAGDGGNRTLLFVSTTGQRRPDGKTNEHRMFRLTSEPPMYFVEHPGPWVKHFQITAHPLVGDFDGNGHDDLLTWTKAGVMPHMYLQGDDGQFNEVQLDANRKKMETLRYWRGVRWGNLTGNKRKDLVVTRGGFRDNHEFWLHVFVGTEEPPYFDFRKPYYTRRLPNVPFGIELLDVNRDGIVDVYVTQRALDSEYCFGDIVEMQETYYGGDAQPPPDWVPPVDRAQDLVLVGSKDPHKNGKYTWKDKVRIRHKMRGCTDMVEAFGNMQTLAVSGGTEPRAGYQYLLEW